MCSHARRRFVESSTSKSIKRSWELEGDDHKMGSQRVPPARKFGEVNEVHAIIITIIKPESWKSRLANNVGLLKMLASSSTSVILSRNPAENRIFPLDFHLRVPLI